MDLLSCFQQSQQSSRKKKSNLKWCLYSMWPNLKKAIALQDWSRFKTKIHDSYELCIAHMDDQN